MADDLAADFIQGELLLDRADVVGDHRHPINHAAILVLTDRVSAGLAHFEQALGAVRAHAGEDDAEGIPARVLGNRIEQHVNRRAEPADLGSAFALDVIAAGILGDPELKPARADDDFSGLDPVAGHRFLDLHLADPVEALRIHIRKDRRHMLDDHNAGGGFGQIAHHLQDRFGTAGGSADRDQGVCFPRGNAAEGGQGSRGSRSGPQPPDLRGRRDLDLDNQIVHEHLHVAGGLDLGFFDKVNRTGVERVKRIDRQRADDDHRQRVLRDQLFDEVDAVHFGHLDVHRHHIGF